jgi:hypothetical protein
MRRFLLIISLLFVIFTITSYAAVIKGTVYNYDSGEPIARVTIRVEGTGRSMLANEQGEYQLRLRPGEYNLKFSHIAHYSEYVKVSVGDSTIDFDVKLHPTLIHLKPIKVYERAYDPAQRIIVEAIRRKEEILSKIHDYSFEAYTKMVLRDTSKADSLSIFLIAESQHVYHWETPDTYKEIITARKQSANVEAGQVLVAVGGILNLNQNRIEVNEYSIVSPTAKDALDYYNYYLLDTIYIDSRPVFYLEIEPKNDIDPLFVGTINIADSTYEVAGVNISFNDAVKLPFIADLQFSQTFAEFEEKYWMPITQDIAGIVDFPIPGIPVIDVGYVSSIHNYEFNTGHPEGTFDEYTIEVAVDADDIDSAVWMAGPIIPLTLQEIRGYERIDSVAHAPKPILKRLLLLSLRSLMLLTEGYDYFHFNRVEGAYIGGAYEKNKILPRLDIRLRFGYAFDAKFWQHDYGFYFTLSKKQRIKFGADYHNKITRRPSIMTAANYNPTFMSLGFKVDQLDYYHEKGFLLNLESKLLNKTKLSISYKDYGQYSETNHSDYSLFYPNKLHRVNPPITEGRLRSLSANFRWDSRPRIKDKNEIFYMITTNYIKFNAGIEYAWPDFIDNDFGFKRYYISIIKRQRMFGWGISSVYLYAGASDSQLPPQRYFIIDFGGESMITNRSFKTMRDCNFAGNRAGVLYLEHNFGTRLFRESRLPIIKKLPFSLSVHGGIFWTEFRNHVVLPGDASYRVAEKPYREIGFGIGRLPMMNLKFMFTWQLSNYDTEKFSFDFMFVF